MLWMPAGFDFGTTITSVFRVKTTGFEQRPFCVELFGSVMFADAKTSAGRALRDLRREHVRAAERVLLRRVDRREDVGQRRRGVDGDLRAGGAPRRSRRRRARGQQAASSDGARASAAEP